MLSGMTLRRGDVADAAVPVFVVVPLHEARSPLPRGLQIGKVFERAVETSATHAFVIGVGSYPDAKPGKGVPRSS